MTEYTHETYPVARALVYCECKGHGCLDCGGDGLRYLRPDELDLITELYDRHLKNSLVEK